MPFACNTNGMSKEQRSRYSELLTTLDFRNRTWRELVDGMGFDLPYGTKMLLEAAEWIGLERLCCPFFSFSLEVSENTMRLSLHGEDGIKEFIKAEFEFM